VVPPCWIGVLGHFSGRQCIGRPFLMAGCIIKQEKASCEAVCFPFENINCVVNLFDQVIVVEVTVTIFTGLEKNASFSAIEN
jgi:hypothetical protein